MLKGISRLVLPLLCACALSLGGCGGGKSGDVAPAAAARVMYKNLATTPELSIPSFYVEGANPAVDTQLYYFFTALPGKLPQLETEEDFALPIELQPLGDDRYRVRLDLADIPGARWPEQGVYSFILSYTDGSAWSAADDYSAAAPAADYAPNPRMPLYSGRGDLLAGAPAPALWLEGALELPPDSPEVTLKDGTAVAPIGFNIDAHDATTSSAQITLTGITHAVAGIVSIDVTSNREHGESYAATLAGGHFSVTLPLAPGVNKLTFTASHASGNPTLRKIYIRRTLPPPQIAVSEPADGLATRLLKIAVAGTVTTDPADSAVVVTVKKQHRAAAPTATPGVFSFSFPAVVVSPGSNRVTIAVKTAGAAAHTGVVVVGDRIAPQITVDAVPLPPGDNTSATLTGQVSDNLSGIATLNASSDRMPGQTFAGAVAADGRYTLEVPMARGANLITLTAIDGAGNSAKKQVTRKRQALGIAIVAPVDGAHTPQNNLTLSGAIETSASDSGLRVTVAGHQQVPTPGPTPGAYSFRFDGVPLLQPGLNIKTVRVESAAGSATATVNVYYDAPENDDHTGPVLFIQAPIAGAVVSDSTVYVVGQAQDLAGVAEVRVNGLLATLIGGDAQAVDFRRSITLAGNGPATLAVTARDALGNTSQQQLTISRDSQAPVLTLTDPVPAGDLLHALDNPLVLSGTVEDSDLAGFSVNDEPQQLTPGQHAGQYFFNLRLPLQYGQDNPAHLLAWDRAGNQTARNYIARNDAQASIEIVSPRDGASFTLAADATDLPVVARIAAAPAGAGASAALGSAQAVLVRDGSSYTGTLSADGLTGAQQLTVKLKSAAGETLASASSQFSIEDNRNAPLALLRSEPATGAGAVEPTDPVTFYFNRTVDPAKLVVMLTETVHGQTFDPAQPEKMQAVNLDQDLVPGNVALLPSGSAATFYPARELTWGSVLLATVVYDGAEIARGSYQVRALPTLVQGMVLDQYRQPAGGIEVSLPQLKLSTVTDTDGNYSFGYGPGAPEIPAGRYRLVANPDMKVQPLGTLQAWTTLQAGRFNHQPAMLLPIINPRVPFTHVASGQGSVPLAAADLQLNFSSVQLLFPNQRLEGDIHVQFVSATSVPARPLAGSTPLWAYAVQPPGVQVSGSLGVQIVPPPLHGSMNYLPADGTWVLLVGFDADASLLRPAGVAQIQNRRIVSAGVTAFRTLDYIGVAFIGSPGGQAALAQYAQGQITLAELTRRLSP